MTVQEPIIARATAVEVSAASSILREAAEWLARRGEALWEMEELTPEQLLPHAAAGELWLATSEGLPVGTMLVQWEDTLHWPEMPAGEAGFFINLRFGVR